MFSCSNVKDRSDGAVAVIDSVSVSVTKSQSVKPIYVSKNPNACNPFNKIDYDRVIAYDYGREGEDSYLQIVDKKGNLDATVIQQKDLTQQQVDDITNYLGKKETYGETPAWCFKPHMGIVFYNGQKIIAHISICLECNLLKSSIEIPATSFAKMNEGAKNEYPLEGFSKEGRTKLNALCKELQFSHCR